MSADLFADIPLFLDAHPLPPESGLSRSLVLPPESLPGAAERLIEAGYHLEDLACLDCAEGLLVNYHFNRYEASGRLVLRVPLPHEDPAIPSIAALFGGAEWHEREVTDFFGVTFTGNPNPAPLLLCEDDRSMPLRKKTGARRPLRELMSPGTIVYKADQFDWFNTESDAEASPEGDDAPDKGGGAS